MSVLTTEIREQILAKYHFSEKELAELGGECGRVTAMINNLKDESKSVAAEYKGRLDARETQRNVISTKLANGYEMRPVEAVVQYHPEHKTKVYIHPDTGAVIREEEMTHADWQLPMFSKEEMEKARKPKPEATEEKPQEPVNDADQAIIEAALVLPKVEVDLDLAAEGANPPAVTRAFKKAVKAVTEWPANIVEGITKIAIAKESEGTAAALEFLRQFVVTK